MASKPIKVTNDDVDLEKIRKNAKNLPKVKIIETQQTDGSTQCGLITFEGLGLENFTPIPPMSLEFATVTFGDSWTSLTAGNYSNEPSPPTVCNLTYSNSGDIFLSNPVSSISLYYASYLDVTVEVYDLSENLLLSKNAPANYQPDTAYSQWDPITINLESNVISRIKIIALENHIVIDNMQLCMTLRRGISFSAC